MILNIWLLGHTAEIRIPFIYSWEMPIILLISAYFVIYILWLWITFKFSNFFSGVAKGKLWAQVSDLKAELYDKQWSLIDDIKKEFSEQLTAYKEIAEKDRKTYKSETDKILNNLQFEVTELSWKIEELKKEK